MSALPLIDDMGVANVGFLIENLGADASELQYLRELVQNSFESIARAQREASGRVEVDFEEHNGVRKLRITDNGDGMTPDEVRENINMLSASGGIQAFDKNFGIGAKITAATRNPFGVMYKCWKDGFGHMTVLGRLEGRYGRLGFPNEDGSVDYWLPLPEEDRHSAITDSGVSVVLLGRSAEDDTTMAPAGADLPSQWAAAYLERRYYRVPDDITLRVLRPVEIYDSERDIRRAIYDTVQGQKHYLEKHSDASGVMDLSHVNARVWWWLLSDEITRGGKTWNNRGHVAALYQDELYEMRSGKGRASALKDFGVYAGHGRIVIYVEPMDVLKANTSRTILILRGNRAIDYAEIGIAFAERMPDELAAFMAGQVSSEHGDHRKAIHKSIKEIEEALQEARYRRSQRGVLDHYDQEAGGLSPRLNEERSGAEPPRRARQEDAAGRIGEDYLRKAREERERRVRGERVDADPLPKIFWDETGDNSTPGRAARYTAANHVITANAKFAPYEDLLTWALAQARERSASEIDEETLRSVCEDEVRRWFEQALSEAVVVLRAYAHDAKWGPMVFDSGLSDEGLTAAIVSHRWHMMSAIKRGLAGRLGRSRASRESAA